jgi:glyoxylase-like metal-dependent hydrolase (beta-lactamase superfamily II)
MQASLLAIRTLGHTDESTSYVLNDAAVFTGDTLFTNGVGHPGLHTNADTARQRARALFASLTRLRTLARRCWCCPRTRASQWHSTAAVAPHD